MKDDQIIYNKLKVMFELQNNMNLIVDQQWEDKHFEWYRAIWIECAELMDHYGWKWWKSQTIDIDQVNLELVDIWHFAISIFLSENSANVNRCWDERLKSLVSTFHVVMTEGPKEEDPRKLIESLASTVLRSHSFDTIAFIELMKSVDMSFDDLFELYVSKNVLNRFRQANGYKEGTYLKNWDGEEDNEVLSSLLRGMDATNPDFVHALEGALSARYAEVKLNNMQDMAV